MKKTFSGDIPEKSFSTSVIRLEAQMAVFMIVKSVLFVRAKKMKKSKKTCFHLQNSGV